MRSRGKIAIRGHSVVLSDMSRRTGISVPHLSNVLSGRRNPSMAVIVKMAADIGISTSDLIVHLTNRRIKCFKAA